MNSTHLHQMKLKLLNKFVFELSDYNMERYEDILESLEFAIEIRSQHKIDYEFNNLLDLMDDVEYMGSEIDDVFCCWDIYKHYKDA